MVICDSSVDSSLKIFISDESMRKFKCSRRVTKYFMMFSREACGVHKFTDFPLIMSTRTSCVGFRDVMYLKLVICIPRSTHCWGVTHKLEKKTLGYIFRLQSRTYCRYRVQIMGVEQIVIFNNNPGFADFQIGNTLLRFVRGPLPSARSELFRYELFALKPGHGSLIEEQNAPARLHTKKHSLSRMLQNIIGNIQSQSPLLGVDTSLCLGVFEAKRSNWSFTRTRKTSSLWTKYPFPVLSEDNKFFLSVILILQSQEIDRLWRQNAISPSRTY